MKLAHDEVVSPIGAMLLVATGQGVCALAFDGGGDGHDG